MLRVLMLVPLIFSCASGINIPRQGISDAQIKQTPLIKRSLKIHNNTQRIYVHEAKGLKEFKSVSKSGKEIKYYGKSPMVVSDKGFSIKVSDDYAIKCTTQEPIKYYENWLEKLIETGAKLDGINSELIINKQINTESKKYAEFIATNKISENRHTGYFYVLRYVKKGKNEMACGYRGYYGMRNTLITIMDQIVNQM